MEALKHERFVAANQELRDILRRVEELDKSDDKFASYDLNVIGKRLLNLTPEIGEASRTETLDARLLDELAEYIENFRALQEVVETLRQCPETPTVPQNGAKQLLESIRSWPHAYLQSD